MSESFFPYYERELRFLRHLTAGFAQRYPKAARRLQLSPDPGTEECLDPHVERLIQAFALTAAGIHRRLDDDFPEISHTLLEQLAPHLLRPMPSMTIVKLVPDPERDRPLHIPRDRPLFMKQINGTACRFQTTYPVTLWPLRTGELSVDMPGRLGLQSEAAAVLRLELECSQALSACPEMTSLRFYLHGPDQYALYELLFGPGVSVSIRNKAGDTDPQPLRLEPVGFDLNVAMLPRVPRSLDGYRLLREYFACPNKFLFFDLHFAAESRESLGRQVEILFFLRQHPGRKYIQNSFQLGCTPAINLFSLTAEPISLDYQQPEYLVEPNVNAPDAYEIYQIEQVSSTAVKGEKSVDFEPIYSLRHGGSPAGYFLAMRRPTQAKERPRNQTTAAAPGALRAPRTPPPKDRPRTEVHLAIVDAQLQPSHPAFKSLTVRTLCTNGTLPSEAGAHPDFTLDSKEAIGLSGIEALVPPTVRRPPQLDRGTHWRLISHLSLNYLSIGDPTADGKSNEALNAFRELLTLYAPLSDTDAELSAAGQIEGITKISSKRSVALPDGFEGPCRGIELTIAFNPDLYQKGSILLLAGVLERFLARYVSLNSFIKLIATTHTGREIKQWPPRSGDQILL